MSVAARPANPPAKREPPSPPREHGALPSRELQELWFATRRRPWRSLVVVPASPGRSALPIALALAEVGGVIRMSPVQLVDASGMDLNRIAVLAMDITGEPAGSSWTSGSGGPSREIGSSRYHDERAMIVAIDSVLANPLAVPLALAADAVLLMVEYGATDLASAHHTLELIGRERVVGAVLVR